MKNKDIKTVVVGQIDFSGSMDNSRKALYMTLLARALELRKQQLESQEKKND